MEQDISFSYACRNCEGQVLENTEERKFHGIFTYHNEQQRVGSNRLSYFTSIRRSP